MNCSTVLAQPASSSSRRSVPRNANRYSGRPPTSASIRCTPVTSSVIAVTPRTETGTRRHRPAGPNRSCRRPLASRERRSPGRPGRRCRARRAGSRPTRGRDRRVGLVLAAGHPREHDPGRDDVDPDRWTASSRAIDRASILTPAFDTQYGPISGHGISPTHEPVNSTSPGRPRATISRAASWPTLKQPLRLTSRCACHCSGVTSRKGAGCTIPALPIATSSGSTAAERRLHRVAVGDIGLRVDALADRGDRFDPRRSVVP